MKSIGKQEWFKRLKDNGRQADSEKANYLMSLRIYTESTEKQPFG
ncbi:MAG: hypothetical protein R3A13_01985 [Bdellovibrionota bacterium]